MLDGDAHKGSILFSSQEMVLLDFDYICHGPKEWDLIPSAIAVRRFKLPLSDWNKFSQSYGYDILQSKYFNVLASTRELNMVSWLYQNRHHSKQIAAEVSKRIKSLVENNVQQTWQAF